MQRYIFFLLFCPSILFAQQIIPLPSYVQQIGGVYSMSNIKKINISDSSILYLAEYLNTTILQKDLPIMMSKNFVEPNAINLSSKNWISNNEEAYKLDITGINIVIQGKAKGIFYGLMSLQQLLHASDGKIITQTIIDEPQMAWRGMHLDVCRHFFSTQFVKKYIDILALHKMNTFHWHLTDDQGWRIEIKKYPLLTRIGSKRSETIVAKNFEPYVGDNTPVEGYYTQEEIKNIIAYAAQRNITIVPEIEMPGHSQAALAAYPQYSCKQQPLSVLTTWGVTDDVFCIKDSTINFLFDILTEVINLFPSPYIHIGGDEVPKTRWKTCIHCQNTMQKHHLKDENELQSYCITQMDSFITSKGRNTIGWDEILEGGLAPNAAVMSWRGEEGGIAAANLKHHVVMCPGSHCYFDHYQGDKKTEPLAIGGYTTVKKVYNYNPIPAKIADENKEYILGAQGNVWTEYIPTEDHVMYMALPRLCALSEVLWTKAEKKNYDDFSKRLLQHFSLLEQLDINYAKSIYDVKTEVSTTPNGLNIKLVSDVPNKPIKYSIDGSSPNLYADNKGILIQKNTIVKAALYENEKQLGNLMNQLFVVNKATGKKIQLTTPPSKSYNNGGSATLVDGIIGDLPWTGREWLGWEGQNMEAIIDLNKTQSIKQIKPYFLKAENNWIYLPKQVELYTSIDGKKYILVKTVLGAEVESLFTGNGEGFRTKNIQTRFIKIKAICAETIPPGRAGGGEAPWLFCGEVVVE